MIKEITITENDSAQRIDSFLHKTFPDYSRSYFNNLIKANSIEVNGKNIKPSYFLKTGDNIRIQFEELAREDQPKAEDIPLKILFEDKNVLIIDKEPGMVVHPAAGNKTGTLVNALLNYFPAIEESIYSEESKLSKERPGLIHRLDKDTSGILVVAKNAKTLYSLSKQIKDRAVRKIYYALCFGWPKNADGKLVNFVGRHPKNRKVMAEIGPEKGREAISFYKVLRFFEGLKGEKLSLVEFDIKTGRTHQIRLQSSLIGHPVMGDSVYGNKISMKLSSEMGITRQLLHAKSIEITLPGSNKQSTFTSDLPVDFKTVLDQLKEISDY